MLCFEINSFELFILLEDVSLITYILLYFKEEFMLLEIIILVK